MNNNNNRVNCLKCKHYAFTWNPKFPNTCKLLGFKSSAMPSTVAYNSTGRICEAFDRKDVNNLNTNKSNVNSNKSSQSVIVSIGNKEKYF